MDNKINLNTKMGEQKLWQPKVQISFLLESLFYFLQYILVQAAQKKAPWGPLNGPSAQWKNYNIIFFA